MVLGTSLESLEVSVVEETSAEKEASEEATSIAEMEAKMTERSFL